MKELGDDGFRHGEGGAVQAVEALGDVAGQLQVLLLVRAHGDVVRLVQQDVRGHQAGIGEQAGVDVVRVFLGFILELGHAGELPKLGVAVQNPGQLGVLRHLALDEKDALLQVDAHGQQHGVAIQHVFPQGGGLLPDGDGVQVRQAVNALVLILQAHEILQGPQVVAQGEGARGLDQAEDPFFLLCFHCDSLLTWSFPHRSPPRAGSPLSAVRPWGWRS